MLNLRLFFPCERAIVSKEELISAFNVIDSVTIEPKVLKTPIPEEAAYPLQWEVVAVWRKTDESDGGRSFEQRLEMLRPNNKAVFSQKTPFKTDKTHLNFRTITKVGAVPISEGEYSLKIFIRYHDESEKWKEMGNYLINVVHKKTEAVNATKRKKKRRQKRV